MEHGHPPVPLLPALEQRFAELEALVREQQAAVAHQQAVVAEGQVTITAYHEQLARAANCWIAQLLVQYLVFRRVNLTIYTMDPRSRPEDKQGNAPVAPLHP